MEAVDNAGCSARTIHLQNSHGTVPSLLVYVKTQTDRNLIHTLAFFTTFEATGFSSSQA